MTGDEGVFWVGARWSLPQVIDYLRVHLGGDEHAAMMMLVRHIDGEQARQDAAVAAAREEQREACALWMQGPDPTMMDVANGETVRGTPLTATPLADRIAELEARERDWGSYGAALVERAVKAEAERDRLAGDALAALAGAGVATPLEGYTAAPFLLKGDIGRLAAERDAVAGAGGGGTGGVRAQQRDARTRRAARDGRGEAVKGPLKTKRRGGKRAGLPVSHLDLLLLIGKHEKYIAARTRAIDGMRAKQPKKEVQVKWAIASANRESYKKELAEFIAAYLGEAPHEDTQEHQRRSASHEGGRRGRPKG